MDVGSAAWLTDVGIPRLSDDGRELDERTPAQQAYRRMTLTCEVVVIEQFCLSTQGQVRRMRRWSRGTVTPCQETSTASCANHPKRQLRHVGRYSDQQHEC